MLCRVPSTCGELRLQHPVETLISASDTHGSFHSCAMTTTTELLRQRLLLRSYKATSLSHLTQENWTSLKRATPIIGVLAGDQALLNSQDRVMPGHLKHLPVRLAKHRSLAEGTRTRNPKTGLPPGSAQTRGTVTTDVSSSHTLSIRPSSPCGISGQGSCFHAPATASLACRTATSGMSLLQTLLSACLYRLTLLSLEHSLIACRHLVKACLHKPMS